MLHCSTTLASGRVWRRIIAPAFCAAAKLFKPRFVLDLGSEGDQQKPVIVAPVVATTEPTPVTPEATEPVYARASDPAAAAPVSSPTTAEAIAAAATPLLGPGPARQRMLDGYGRLRQTLGEPGVTRRAAAAILDQLPAAAPGSP